MGYIYTQDEELQQEQGNGRNLATMRQPYINEWSSGFLHFLQFQSEFVNNIVTKKEREEKCV